MSDVVIAVEHLSKQYHLGVIGHRTLYRALQAWWARVRGREDPNLPLDGGRRKKLEQFADEEGIIHALQDISFEVRRGEVLGIIGKNGAGKSTLLKILSRVTAPTSGCVKIKGRVGSLLEVGTGFHPELTGRENIYMNGAILGMKKREIDRKLDEIIDFAGIEPFIDTPVKRYSSGMYVRLAFAVAAHLEPEILLVDEVLAVGDAEFQRKCIGKMGDVSKKEGRTVLFVSHNMAAVEKLCRRGFLLEKGRIAKSGEMGEVIDAYLQDGRDASLPLSERKERWGSQRIRVQKIELRNERGLVINQVKSGDLLDIYLYFENDTPGKIRKFTASILVKTHHDIPVFLQHNRLTANEFSDIPASGAFVCRIRKLPLPPSVYQCTFSLLQENDYIDGADNAFELRVVEGNFFPSGETPPTSHGLCLVDAEWRLE